MKMKEAKEEDKDAPVNGALAPVHPIDQHRGTAKGGKKKARRQKVKVVAIDRGRNLYRLAKAADPKEFKPSTHAGAVMLALKKLGSATSAQIRSEVKRQRRIATTMELDKAVGWMLMDLKRRHLVVSKNAPAARTRATVAKAA